MDHMLNSEKTAMGGTKRTKDGSHHAMKDLNADKNLKCLFQELDKYVSQRKSTLTSLRILSLATIPALGDLQSVVHMLSLEKTAMDGMRKTKSGSYNVIRVLSVCKKKKEKCLFLD